MAQIQEQGAAAETWAARLRRVPGLYPRAVWVLALANTILWVGRGMMLPYILIYFSDIAGLAASLVGGAIAVSAVATSAFVLVAAGQIDRRGAQPVLVVAVAAVGGMTFVYPWATAPITFLVATVLYFMADQLYWPAVNSATVPLAGPRRVTEALALIRCSYIAGVGLGGLLGGTMVSGRGMDAYRLMYTFAAGVILLGTAIIWRWVPAVKMASHDHRGIPGAWRDVLPDRLYLFSLAVLFVVILGYSQLQISIPAFLHREAGIAEGAIGALLLAKTLVTLGLQLPVAARINVGNIGKALAVASLFFSAGLLWVAATTGMGLPAAGLVFLLFTAGELLFAPITSVLPVRMAPAHLRGRYFAAQSVVWGAAWGLASFSGGAALDSPWPALLWPLLAGLMLLAAYGSWRLRGEVRLEPWRAEAP